MKWDASYKLNHKKKIRKKEKAPEWEDGNKTNMLWSLLITPVFNGNYNFPADVSRIPVVVVVVVGRHQVAILMCACLEREGKRKSTTSRTQTISKSPDDLWTLFRTLVPPTAQFSSPVGCYQLWNDRWSVDIVAGCKRNHPSFYINSNMRQTVTAI